MRCGVGEVYLEASSLDCVDHGGEGADPVGGGAEGWGSVGWDLDSRAAVAGGGGGEGAETGFYDEADWVGVCVVDYY